MSPRLEDRLVVLEETLTLALAAGSVHVVDSLGLAVGLGLLELEDVLVGLGLGRLVLANVDFLGHLLWEEGVG